MTTEPTPIDITNIPDLLRLAEEVEATKKPRVLKRHNTPIALLAPVKRQPMAKTKQQANYEAFLSAAGSWKQLIDAEQFKKDIYESRKLSTRLPVQL
jgi:hypothetical protein